MAPAVCTEQLGTWLTQWADRLMLNWREDAPEFKGWKCFIRYQKMTSTGPKLKTNTPVCQSHRLLTAPFNSQLNYHLEFYIVLQ